MNDNDKMRAEFEAAANADNFFTLRTRGGDYINNEVAVAWHFYQLAYAVGQKAESDLKNAIEDIIGEAAFEGLPESKQESLLRLIGQDYKPEGER